MFLNHEQIKYVIKAIDGSQQKGHSTKMLYYLNEKKFLGLGVYYADEEKIKSIGTCILLGIPIDKPEIVTNGITILYKIFEFIFKDGKAVQNKFNLFLEQALALKTKGKNKCVRQYLIESKTLQLRWHNIGIVAIILSEPSYTKIFTLINAFIGQFTSLVYQKK